MGRHVIMYCDRCKKEMCHVSGFFVHRYVFRWSHICNRENDEYELCKDCTDELNAFFRNPDREHTNCKHCAHHKGVTSCGLLKARDGKSLVFNDWDSCPHFEKKVVE